MSLKDFAILEKIGSGTFATVYKTRRLIDQKIYALKKIDMRALGIKQKNNALNEVRLLACLNSPYIISYCQAFFQQKLDLLCIAMQYADGGDLFKTIQKHKKQKSLIPQIQIWKILLHLLYGLNELHTKKILHRDLKSENVFINNGVYKIGDMNVSKIAKNGLAITQTGTPFYASPQVWNDEPYNQKSDIWSLGCILFQLASLNPPFDAPTMQRLFDNVTKGATPKIPKNYSKQLQLIINNCLNKNPLNRPSTNQLLENFTVKLYQNLLIEYKPEIDQAQKSNLLKTIYMPSSKKQLKNQLPQSNYKTDSKKQSKQSHIQQKKSQIKQQIKQSYLNNLSIPINNVKKQQNSCKNNKKSKQKSQQKTKRTSSKQKKSDKKQPFVKNNKQQSSEPKRQPLSALSRVNSQLSKQKSNSKNLKSRGRINSCHLAMQANSIKKQNNKQNKQNLIARAESIIQSQKKKKPSQQLIDVLSANLKSERKKSTQLLKSIQKNNIVCATQIKVDKSSVDGLPKTQRKFQKTKQNLKVVQNKRIQQNTMIKLLRQVQELKPKRLIFEENSQVGKHQAKQNRKQINQSQVKTIITPVIINYKKTQELSDQEFVQKIAVREQFDQTQTKNTKQIIPNDNKTPIYQISPLKQDQQLNTLQNNSVISQKNHTHYNFNIGNKNQAINQLDNIKCDIVQTVNINDDKKIKQTEQLIVQKALLQKSACNVEVEKYNQKIQLKNIDIRIDINQNQIQSIRSRKIQENHHFIILCIQGLEKINSYMRNKNLICKLVAWSHVKKNNQLLVSKQKEQKKAIKSYNQSSKMIVEHLQHDLVKSDEQNKVQISKSERNEIIKRARSKSMPKTQKLKNQHNCINKNSNLNIGQNSGSKLAKKCQNKFNIKNQSAPKNSQIKSNQRKKIFEQNEENNNEQIQSKIKQIVLVPSALKEINNIIPNDIRNEITQRKLKNHQYKASAQQYHAYSDHKNNQFLSKAPYCNMEFKQNISKTDKKINGNQKAIFSDKLDNFQAKKKKIFQNEPVNLRQGKTHKKTNNAVFEMSEKLQRMNLQNRLKKYMIV